MEKLFNVENKKTPARAGVKFQEENILNSIETQVSNVYNAGLIAKAVYVTLLFLSFPKWLPLLRL